MKRAVNILLSFLTVLAVFFTWGCDATRDNPLDPESPLYRDPPQKDRATEFLSFEVKTRHIAPTHPEGEQYYVDIEAEIYDADGINEVQLELADSLRYNMIYDSQRQLYYYTFYPEADNLYAYQGESFYIYVYDNRGFVRKSWRESISRIIDFPEQKNPTNTDTTVTIHPTLEWQWMGMQFDYYYEVEVKSINGTQQFYRNNIEPSERNPNIPIEEQREQLYIETTLSIDGSYLWYVRVWDDKGNLGESATLLFTVRRDSGGTIVN